MLIGVGAGASPEFDVAAFLMSRYFGLREYGCLFGVHLGLITLRSTLSPWLFGQLYRSTVGLKADEADSGAVTLIQRFGSAANLMVQPQYPRYASH